MRCAGRTDGDLRLDYLRQNLDRLAVRHAELARLISGLPEGGVEIFPSLSGMPSASIGAGSSTRLLHSRYDPVKEARRVLASSDLSGADYLVFLGFGLGYILDAARETNTGSSHRYFVVESDLQLLRAAFTARDLRDTLSSPHVRFAWPPTGPALALQWKEFFDPVRARKTGFVIFPPSVELAPELFKSAAAVIQSETFQIYTDINTLVARSRTFLGNYVRNLPRAARAPGIASFAGRFRDVPCALISAGPSLDRNIADLRGREEEALILATDTSLKPLLAAGVEPHFILTGDPGYANYLHLRGSKPNHALLVAEATTYPESMADFDERTICCVYVDSALRSLSEPLVSKGMLRAWGSVATMALDFALVLGCNPIIFVGQDLAHTEGRTYCSGLHCDRDWFPPGSGVDDWQKQWELLRAGKTEIAGHPATRFINATEGGILREGVQICSLREALYRHAGTNVDLRRRVLTLFQQAMQTEGRCPSAPMETLEADSLTVRKIIHRALTRRDEAEPAAEQLMSALEADKDSIYAQARRLAPIVDCFNQVGNVTFLRRRAGLVPRENDRNTILDVYSDYFSSILTALDEIEPALRQLRGILKPG
jgi:hypothetical protein